MSDGVNHIIPEGRRLANAMTPPIIAAAGPLLARYDVVFCDVWGVMHKGRGAYAEAVGGSAAFEGRAGPGILAPMPRFPPLGGDRGWGGTGWGGPPGRCVVDVADLPVG